MSLGRDAGAATVRYRDAAQAPRIGRPRVAVRWSRPAGGATTGSLGVAGSGSELVSG